MKTSFPYLPRECQTGTCDHDPGRCVRYRSRQCLSGECTHASRNLHCGQNYDTPALQGPQTVRGVDGATEGA